MKSFFCLLFFLLPFCMQAQSKLFSKAAKIFFISKAPMEDIEARNNTAVSIWDVSTGQIEFSLLIKGFEFKKALMQEHFNDDYMESDRYPKASFKGTLKGIEQMSLQKDGVYQADIIGLLTIHGITKTISVAALITVKNNNISARSEFSVAVADYNIKIPSIVANNISKQIKVQVYVPAYHPVSN